MKRLPLTVTVLLLAAGIATGAQDVRKSADRGPEVINLKMGLMVLPLKHWEHQELLKGDCRQCHTKNIGKIEGWSEETAHRICISCHDLEEKGPVACHQCHKK